MVEAFPSPDEVFQDRYRILSVIDRGGFARVYRAEQLELKRDVAIKVLQPVRRTGTDASEEEARLEVIAKRFTREAQLVSQLRDSHTVTMHDYGTTDEGLLYMVLEFIDGEPLSSLIALEGALTPERTVRITRQILSSLEEAHALGMLHRDIKPANVMLFDHAGRTDQVKVLDFGLAKSVDNRDFTGDDPDLTGDEVILGTPRYMSPEQIRGEPLDARTDIYSLGLVIYEMLTGFKAVEGESTMKTLARHLTTKPIQLPATTSVPARLRSIVDRMLLKDPDERYVSTREVLDALEDWDQSRSVTLDSRFDGGVEPVVPPPEQPEDPADRKRRNVWIGIGAVMGLFLLLAVISSAIGTNDTNATLDASNDQSAESEDDEAWASDVEEGPAVSDRDERSEEDSDEFDPFAKAGIPKLPPDDSAELDEEPEKADVENDDEEQAPTARRDVSTETPPSESNTKSSTNPNKSGTTGKRKKKEKKLKLRVLQ